ncbi:hypothetical protein SHIRM173S_10394 [Streptomyces hirsutus]
MEPGSGSTEPDARAPPLRTNPLESRCTPRTPTVTRICPTGAPDAAGFAPRALRVSWHHAVLHPGDGRWTIEDESSTNGTYTDGHRVHVRDVGPGSVIRFGSPHDGPSAVLIDRPPPPPNASPPCRTPP